MIETATDFPYLGDRDYIHGTSILSGFLAALEKTAHGGITVKRLKFQRPAKLNGRLVLSSGALDEAEAARASCTLSAAVGGVAWRGFFIDEGAPVTRRIAVSYPIAELEAEAFGGSCLISPGDRDDLVRALVEANKRFHEAAVPGPGAPAVRFGYLESWSVPPRDVSFGTGRLDAKNLIAKKTDDGYMTINRLTYGQADGARASLTLCFDVHRQAPS